MQPDPHRPLGRRAFIADVAASGAVLLGSVAWALGARAADASPTPSPSGSVRPPREDDHRPLPGEPVAPPSPRPSRRPTRTPSGAPREHDHRPLPGRIAAPKPPPPSPPRK